MWCGLGLSPSQAKPSDSGRLQIQRGRLQIQLLWGESSDSPEGGVRFTCVQIKATDSEAKFLASD